MKTVLIIGNGLDLNLGRKTSYSDFWKSPYCPKNYPAPLIYHLNKKWSEENEAVKWYDLENELLNYVHEIKKEGYGIRNYDIVTPEEQKMLKRHRTLDGDNIAFHDNDYNIIRSLTQKGFLSINHNGEINTPRDYYDELQLSAIERDKKALQMIKDGLCKFLSEIRESDDMNSSVAMAILHVVYQLFNNPNEEVYVYTFNYTNLPHDYNNDLNPQYIHGSCTDGNIIIGTKDSKELGKDYDFMQKSFDPNFRTPPVVYDLLNADNVIFFGHSLGMNDSQYLKPFFKQQTNISNPKSKNITIFTKDDKSVLEIKRALQDMTDYSLSLLNSINKVEMIKTDDIKKNPKEFEMFLDRIFDGDYNSKTNILQVICQSDTFE